MEIQHAIHEHPLSLQEGLWGYCSACWRSLSGSGFGCRQCRKFFHKSCLDELKLDEHGFKHFAHPHPLKPVDLEQQKDDEVVCSICEEIRSSSSTYGCMECKFFVHKTCLTSIPPRLTNHLIHPCTLARTSIFYYFSCDKCHSNWPNETFFCKPCGFYLHVKCAMDSVAESEEAKEIRHVSHPHPLSLIQNHQQYGKEPSCAACAETCLPPTPTLRCIESSCTRFFLHKSCAVNFPHQPRLSYHPCHPKHQLTITSLPYNGPTCGACCWRIDSSLFAYTCRDVHCGFGLHLDCAKLFPTFESDGHRHPLTLFDITPGFTCHLCGVNCTTFVLRCVPCNFNIHLQCLPSKPKTVTHKSHLHPLIHTNSPFEYELNSEEDAYNSDDEFYCDVCEEKRFKRDPVYYCADCKFIAELKCVIDEVLPLIPRREPIQQVDPRDYDRLHVAVPPTGNANDGAWEISKALYKIEELKHKKREQEKSLELTVRDLQETENRFKELVARAHR
ncbi:uncharacterized protein LOC120136727 [Hibiscus syriacus]|nr:uncharacterized protein LOC120136727 [Hibiscus syriacus]